MYYITLAVECVNDAKCTYVRTMYIYVCEYLYMCYSDLKIKPLMMIVTVYVRIQY